MGENQKYADLHVHTSVSDGSFSAEEVVEMALDCGLTAVAITDHDSVDNVKLAVDEGKNLGVEVVAGVELTVDDEQNEIEDIHIIGLFIDVDDAGIKVIIKNSKIERLKQKKLIIGKLNELGYKIDFEEVRKIAKWEISRLHIAKILVSMNDKLESTEQAFEELIGIGKPAYVRRANKLPIKKAVSAIHNAGGIVILAHPYLYGIDLNYLIDVFVKEGGDGIEVYYPYNITNRFKDKTKNELDLMQKKLMNIILKRGLAVSGGSDFHGTDHGLRLGEFKVPYDILENLKRFNKDNSFFS